jgi:ketosteroid isomerase-like protein
MLKFLIMGLALAAATVACGSAASTSTPDPELQRRADLYEIEQLEVIFHKAASRKDIELMMSIWADDATFVLGPQTYTGKDEIRNFFLTKSGPFKPENTWEGDTPAYKIVVTVDGDKGTLYYECHFIDVATRAVVSATAANASVARINGVWVITNQSGGTATLSP